jgi:hypothetical protein
MEPQNLDEAQHMLGHPVDNVLQVNRLVELVKLGAARDAGWQRDGDLAYLSEAVGIQRPS